MIYNKKKNITISIDKKILENIEKLTTNKSVLIEQLFMEYVNKKGIKNDDIIL